ncbi:MAG TPA: polysaccharide ABC transporter ATP-binding protein [Bryobacteraceae bacterium]|nr:polysaccharide ABC transporter ATP-binding protein [Bryobacteraceae bacterium]
MSRPVIQIEGLGKRYWLSRKQDRSYTALRDVISEGATKPLRMARAMFQRGSKNSNVTLGDKEYFWALDDVTFDVRPGEVIGVIGRNGAGKSTLLKVLSRITEPSTGKATIYGRVGSLLEVGTGFHPELSGRENIFMNGSILGMRRVEIERKFDEIVAFAEVERFIDTPVKRYSSGMYMRLAFSVAAHLEPEVLFIDEVLAVGDVAFQKKCLGKMGDISRQGRTVIFVSHNMTAVQSLCNRAVWLGGGKVVDIGETRAVVGHYLQTAARSASEQIWDSPAEAPGDDRVRLRRIAVTATGVDAGMPIEVSTPFQVEVEFRNYLHDAVLNVCIEVFNVEEVCIFASFSKPQPCAAGLVRSVCDVPGKLLNNSLYRVRVVIVRDASVHLLSHESVSFEILDGGRDVGYYGKWVGAVRPDLAWRTEVLAAEEVAAAV